MTQEEEHTAAPVTSRRGGEIGSEFESNNLNNRVEGILHATVAHDNVGAIPRELTKHRQWVVWRYLLTEGDKKPRKVPFTPTSGDAASSTDPETWGTWEEALAAHHRGGWEGLGYVFTADGSVAGIDIDSCVDAATGAVEPWAQVLIDMFDSYTEQSPSGRGIHILMHGSLPGGNGRKRGPFEAYSQGRYFTMTGKQVPGTRLAIEHRQDELEHFLASYFPVRTSPATIAQHDRCHRPLGNPLDDDALLAKMHIARNGAKVKALWNGDADHYPSQSDADLALCAYLAWWTNGDAERIDRMFRRSGLMREKWDERHGQQTYGERTIACALDGLSDGYSGEPNFKESDAAGPVGADAATTTTGRERRPSLATQLVSLANTALLFHDEAQVTWASIPTEKHYETWPLHSKSFKRWLARQLYEQEGRTASAQSLQDALSVLDGNATYDGPLLPVHVRMGEHEGSIYLDLGDEDWHAVKISAAGWEVMENDRLPIKFRRPKGMLALPLPTQGGLLDDLRAFVNVQSEEDWRLLLAWIVGALRPSGPFPVLGLNGEMGSAKTTLARVLRALVDPNTAPVRAEPKELRDLAIAANNSWVLVLDNLSSLPVWLSDGLCRMSTGGGSAYRTLYENDQETIFDAQRPIILTGIEEVATRGDLVDRAILLALPTIPDTKRRAESAFWRDFDQKRPGILGVLLDAVSGALLNEPRTELASLPRMADFAVWVTAAEDVLSWESGTFLAAYITNRKGANNLALESSPVAERLMAFMDDQSVWDGTATQLYEALMLSVGDAKSIPPGWPKTPKGLSGSLMRLAPNLRRIGIIVTHYRASDAKGTRKLVITREDSGWNASDASDASIKQQTSDGKGVQDIQLSDAPKISDTSLTQPHLYTKADVALIPPHVDASDAELAAFSPVLLCPECGNGDAIKLYRDEDGLRQEMRCRIHDVLAIVWAPPSVQAADDERGQ